MTPAHERKAKERQAKRDAGLVRVEAWVPRDMADEVRAYAAEMASKPRVVWEGGGKYTMHNLKDGAVMKFPEPDGQSPKVTTAS